MQITSIQKSSDGMATKFLQETPDGFHIETTYVNYFNKHIICFSTQIGCCGRCIFCANGIANKFIRNLTSGEILSQITTIINYMGITSTFNKPILFSAMGCGEPLQNSSEIATVFSVLRDIYPTAKFAMATTGNMPEKLSLLLWVFDKAKLNFKPMISLHSAKEDIRKKLLPNSGDLYDLMNVMEEYQRDALGRHQVDYNVVLFDGVNDQKSDAAAIYNLLSSRNILKTSVIKINKFNPVSGCELQPSKRQDEFIRELKIFGCTLIEEYETNGSDIGAACGQLMGY